MEGLSIYNIGVAFIGGVLSFLSPCVLPLVPSYISLITGVSVESLKIEKNSNWQTMKAVIFNSLAFNAGVSVIFLFLGATAGLVGAAFFNNFWVSLIGGIVIIGFGLQMMGFFRFGAYYKDTRFLNSQNEASSILGSFILGLAFAAGWTPCIGPMMSGIIILAASTGGWQSGLILSAFYSLGLALPFLVVGLLFEQFLSFYRNFRRHLQKVEIASGALLILIGLLVASGNVAELNNLVSGVVPDVEKHAPQLKVDDTKAPAQTTQNQNFPAAPEVVYQTLEGNTVNLSELRGRVVLLNLWAKWCVPCQEEIPTFNEMHKNLESQGLSIIGITFEDSASEIKTFQQKHPMDYAVGIGKQPSRSELYVGLPTTYLIDRQGRVRQKFVGIQTREQFEAEIKLLLEEK